MNAFVASKVITAVVLLTTLAEASSSHASGLTESVMAAQAKLRRDQVSLAIFRYLGKTYCLDTLTEQKPGNFSAEYGILYNQLYPLPRLISEKALHGAYSVMQKDLVRVGGYGQKSSVRFVDPISVCTRLYEVGSRSSITYRSMVADPKSLHASEDVDLDQHAQDYLDGYFIKPPR